MCPGGPMALRCYGELGGRACDDGGDRQCASSGGGGVARGTAAASACWSPRSRATELEDALQGEVMPCWLWEPAGGSNMTDDCTHGA